MPVHRNGTSMYSELLAESLRHQRAGEERSRSSPAALLAEAVECRHRLVHLSAPAGTGPGGAVSSADSLALQLEYDLALLRLCAARGIECDPSRFVQPPAERRRLEDTLAALGVDLDDTA